MPPPSRSPKRSRPNWLWISLGIFVVLGVVGAFSARPVWRAIKSQRAMTFAKEAEKHIQEKNLVLAAEKTRSALQLAPSNPAILRLAANLYASAGLEIAFPYFESLLATPSATTADKEEYIGLALRSGHSELAANQLRALLAEPKPSARTFLLAAQFHGSLRNFSNAVFYAREALRTQPDNPTNTIALGRTLLASRIPADQNEARDVLWPFARVEGRFQAAALAAILATPDAPRSEREEVLAILDAKNKRTLVEEMLRHDALVSLDPSQSSNVADQLIESHGRSSEDGTIAVATWLNRQQLFTRTLDLVLPDIALKRPELLQLRYDALMGIEDYRGAYDFIAKASVPGNPIQLEILRCNTALRLKDQAAIDSHFENLLGIAARDPKMLRNVADYALRNGRRDIANEAAKRLVRSPRDAASAYATLMKIADAQGETWAARDYARRLLELRGVNPDDSIKLQIAYYDLLLDENVDAAFAIAEAMQKAMPTDFTRRAVLGLAYLRKDQPKAAVELIDHQFVTWAKLPAGIRAITIAILGANKREQTSAGLIRRVPIARLKPEERDLIRPYASGDPVSATEDAESDEAPEKL